MYHATPLKNFPLPPFFPSSSFLKELALSEVEEEIERVFINMLNYLRNGI